EIFKAETSRPLIEWSGGALLPVGDQVVLTEPRRVVAVAQEYVADGSCAPRNDRIIAGIAAGKLRNVAVADAVMIAPGEKCGTRRRAECGGVELIVANSLLVNPLQVRRRDRTTKGARGTEASIIGHDQQHVRSALGRRYCRRIIRLRVSGL